MEYGHKHFSGRCTLHLGTDTTSLHSSAALPKCSTWVAELTQLGSMSPPASGSTPPVPPTSLSTLSPAQPAPCSVLSGLLLQRWALNTEGRQQGCGLQAGKRTWRCDALTSIACCSGAKGVLAHRLLSLEWLHRYCCSISWGRSSPHAARQGHLRAGPNRCSSL